MFDTPSTALSSTIEPLSPQHLPDLLRLQDVIINALPADQKNVILVKTPEQMTARMTDLGKTFGVFADTPQQKKHLIAYAVLALPSETWPVADMVLPPDKLPCAPTALGVLQSSSVHPAFRGHHLHLSLIEARMEVCAQLGRTDIMSEIAVVNTRSLVGLMKEGMQIITTAVDPDDGCKLVYVHKKLSGLGTALPQPVPPPRTRVILNPTTEAGFARTAQLLAQGFTGTSITVAPDKKSYLLALDLCA